MDTVILLLGVIGLAAALLMKYSKKVRKAAGLDNPAVNQRYANYKANFIIAVCLILIAYEAIGMFNPSIKGKYDFALSVVLIGAILVDMLMKQKMKREIKK
jgi:hypothetical protein